MPDFCPYALECPYGDTCDGTWCVYLHGPWWSGDDEDDPFDDDDY